MVRHKSPKILSSKNFYYLNSHVNNISTKKNSHSYTLIQQQNVVHKSIVSVFSSLRRAARQRFLAPTNISNTSSRYQHHTPSIQPKPTNALEKPQHIYTQKNTFKPSKLKTKHAHLRTHTGTGGETLAQFRHESGYWRRHRRRPPNVRR